MAVYGYIRINYQRTQPKGFTLEEQESQIETLCSCKKSYTKRIIQDEAETSATLICLALRKFCNLLNQAKLLH